MAHQKIKVYSGHMVYTFRHLGSPQMPKCVNYVSGIICKLSVDKHTTSYANPSLAVNLRLVARSSRSRSSVGSTMITTWPRRRPSARPDVQMDGKGSQDGPRATHCLTVSTNHPPLT